MPFSPADPSWSWSTNWLIPMSPAHGTRNGGRMSLNFWIAGIDVYTTLNVQHVESRKEYVEQITGITVRETVPDTILQRAAQIILVDLTPTELLQRLKDGKVYLGDKAEAASKNFFQEDRLTALREIALRFTAEAVDNELQGLTAAQQSTGILESLGTSDGRREPQPAFRRSGTRHPPARIQSRCTLAGGACRHRRQSE